MCYSARVVQRFEQLERAFESVGDICCTITALNANSAEALQGNRGPL
jgi:hypothetical protein